MKELSYLKQLEAAEENNLNIYKLYIAQSIKNIFEWHETIFNNEMFNIVCDYVYECYIDLDTYTLDEIIFKIDFYIMNNYSINEITEMTAHELME